MSIASAPWSRWMRAASPLRHPDVARRAGAHCVAADRSGATGDRGDDHPIWTSLPPQALAHEAALMMAKHGFRHVLVVER